MSREFDSHGDAIVIVKNKYADKRERIEALQYIVDNELKYDHNCLNKEDMWNLIKLVIKESKKVKMMENMAEIQKYLLENLFKDSTMPDKRVIDTLLYLSSSSRNILRSDEKEACYKAIQAIEKLDRIIHIYDAWAEMTNYNSEEAMEDIEKVLASEKENECV